MNYFVKKFYHDLQNDEIFKRRIFAAKERFKNLQDPKERICTIIERVILPYAEKKGYNFDIYDLLIFEEESSHSGANLLEEPLLERVSGGGQISVKSAQDFLNISGDLGDLATYWYEKNKEALELFYESSDF